MKLRFRTILLITAISLAVTATAQQADSLSTVNAPLELARFHSAAEKERSAFNVPGLSVNMGTSVFSSWGGRHRRGTGFTQDIDVTYTTQLSPRTTLVVGGYVDNTLWRGSNYTVAGIRALLNYRIDNHWSAYAFVQKAFTSDNVGRYGSPYIGYGGFSPMGYYGYAPYHYYGCRLGMNAMDRVGAGLRYEWGKYNQNSVEIQVEMDRAPSHTHGYNLQRYDYPVR